MEACLSLLRGEILCRDHIIRLIYSLIGRLEEPLPDCLFVYGHVATGKSLIINKMLNHLKPNYSIVNCIEHPNGRHIYEYILADLACEKLSSSDAYRTEWKCENILSFIAHLRKIASNDRRPIFIVFDKCDRLRDVDENMLPALLRLRELSGLNVCTIFMSDIVWEKYRVKMGMIEPIKVHFSQYTRDELAQILYLEKPDKYGNAFYKNYLNLFLSVYFRFCRDLNELRYMSRINFAKYVEPIEMGICDEKDVAALWRNISGVFKTNLEVIYLRVSSDDFVERTQMSQDIESTTKLALGFQLPFYAKYLLIAAYLASYNPAKEDKRLFVKQQSSKTKKRKTASKKADVMYTRTGPKNFPLDRMLAIFCAILGEKVDLNANLLAQIPTLCQLGLLANVGDNNLDEPKFKCCVSYDFVTVISKTVGFSVKNYLYDFIH